MEETELLLSEEERQDVIDVGRWEYLIFMTIGMGVSYGLCNALYLEVPWFESTQPEGIRLSAWMGMAGTIAAAFSLVISRSGVVNKFSGHKSTLVLIILNISLFLFIAFTWSSTIGGLSVFVFLVTFGGGMIGNFQFMILLPWVSANFPPTATNALFSGSSLMSFICVVMQLIQSPGANPRFSPTWYFFILALPSFLSVRSIFLVQRINKVKEASRTMGGQCDSLCPPWFIQNVLKYTFLIIWSAMLSWWILLIILPYATANTDAEHHLGSEILQWATALGIGALLVGNILSSFVGNERNFHLVPTVLLMTLLEVVVFLAVFDIPRGGFWRTEFAKCILVLDVTLIRIAFGFVCPLVFRDIARRMPEISEQAGRLMAFWTQVFSMVVNIIMFCMTSNANTNMRVGK